jgi:hypothetical protein
VSQAKGASVASKGGEESKARREPRETGALQASAARVGNVAFRENAERRVSAEKRVSQASVAMRVSQARMANPVLVVKRASAESMVNLLLERRGRRVNGVNRARLVRRASEESLGQRVSSSLALKAPRVSLVRWVSAVSAASLVTLARWVRLVLRVGEVLRARRVIEASQVHAE